MILAVNVTVTETPRAQRELLGRLLELNAYEFSRFDGRPIGGDGRYGYEYLDLYWSENDRWPYTVRVGDELAGFALVRSEDDVLSIAEFLVLPKFRRTGVGAAVARDLFARHRGTWHVDQIPANTAATDFWRRAIPVPFDEDVDGAGHVVQRFVT